MRDAVRPMVDAALAAQSALDDTPDLSGEVTITTVGEVVRWELCRRLPDFADRFPHLHLRVLTSNLLHSLAAGEADLALRFLRPESGDLAAERLGRVQYGVFAAEGIDVTAETAYLGLAGALEAIPEQRYAEQLFHGRPPRVAVEDVESLGLAVQAGLGLAVLPLNLARQLGGLQQLDPADVAGDDAEPLPARDLWLVVHRARRDLPKIRAVAQWLRERLSFTSDADVESQDTPGNGNR